MKTKLLLISSLLVFGLNLFGQTNIVPIRPSQLPQTNSIGFNDLIIENAWNGSSYPTGATHSITWSNALKSAYSQSVITNAPPVGALMVSNQLSDITNAAIARSNLSILSGALNPSNAYALSQTGSATNLTSINQTNFSQTWMVTNGLPPNNLYPGTGTISSSGISTFVTNSGTGFSGINFGTFIVASNYLGQVFQLSVQRRVSPSVVSTFDTTGSGFAYTNVVWSYYTNHVSIFDSVPRQVGAFDNAGGLWISGLDLANVGALWFGGNGTNTMRIRQTLQDGHTDLQIQAPGPNGQNYGIVNIEMDAFHDMLNVYGDSTIGLGGLLTNVYGSITSTVPIVLKTGQQLILVGTTNTISFGGTNAAPSNTNAVGWIAVQVSGNTNRFAIPVMQY